MDAPVFICTPVCVGDGTDNVLCCPVLNRQNEFATFEITGIAVDRDSCGNNGLVNYNFQGVRTDNPSCGLYIVKFGRIVTEKYIR